MSSEGGRPKRQAVTGYGLSAVGLRPDPGHVPVLAALGRTCAVGLRVIDPYVHIRPHSPEAGVTGMEV